MESHAGPSPEFSFAVVPQGKGKTLLHKPTAITSVVLCESNTRRGSRSRKAARPAPFASCTMSLNANAAPSGQWPIAFVKGNCNSLVWRNLHASRHLDLGRQGLQRPAY